MQSTIKRTLSLAVALLMATAMQGCQHLNSVRETVLTVAPIDAEQARLVYGIDVSRGSVAIALDRVDPVTGKGGDCARHDYAEASATGAEPGIKYFVFDVPPGYYSRSFLNTAGSFLNSDPGGFAVPAGQATYIGDFSRFLGWNPSNQGALADMYQRNGPGLDLNGQPIYQLNREGLEAAKLALGPGASDLVLAEIVPSLENAPGFLCVF